MRGKQPTDPSAGKDYGNFERVAEKVPHPPEVFSVEIDADKEHLKFTVGKKSGSPPSRVAIATYRVYFAASSLLLPGATMDQATIRKVWNAAQLVDSKPAVQTQSVVTFLDRQFLPKSGYFFATCISIAGIESEPTSPILNPSLSANASPSVIPRDVTEQQVAWVPVLQNGTTTLRITVSARPPTDTSFAGFQVYISNYMNADPSFTSYVEGPFFARPETLPASGFVVGSFVFQPDVPSVYSVGTVDIAAGSATVTQTLGTSAQWPFSWQNVRRITVIDGEAPGSNYFDYAIASMGLTSQMQGIIYTSVVPAWVTTNSCSYAVYSFPAGTNVANQVAPHPVRIYFVSVSKAGTRRPDVLNSPYIELPFGLTASMSAPPNPINVTATTQGVSVSLKWNVVVSDGSNFDPTVKYFRIYRTRFGTYSQIGTQVASMRPSTPYATVRADTSGSALGGYSFVDRGFDIDSTSATYDFNSADPGVYFYYVTAVNTEDLESNLGFAGTGTTSGGASPYKTFTRTGGALAGDYFRRSFAGATITVAGTADTVSSVTSATVLTLTTGTTSVVTDVIWTIGGVVYSILRATTGPEVDPTIYRDNFWNRLYNASFYTTYALANPSIALQIAENGTYSVVNPPNVTLATDKQIPWLFWDSTYKTGTTRTLGTAGTATHNDDFTVWEHKEGGTGTVAAFLIRNSAHTGEVQLDDGAGATSADYTYVCQMAAIQKFLVGENLVLHCAARATLLSGTPAGNFILEIAGVYSVPGVPTYHRRYYQQGIFPASQILNTIQRFVLIGKLRTPHPADATVIVPAESRGTFSMTNASVTATWVNVADPGGYKDDVTAQNYDDLTGQQIYIEQGGTYTAYTISTYTPNTGVITLTGAYGGTTANHAYYMQLDVNRVESKIILSAQNDKPSYSGTVNTNGTTVNWVAGDQFAGLPSGNQITINAVVYTIDHLVSATQLVLTTSAGVQAGVAYSASTGALKVAVSKPMLNGGVLPANFTVEMNPEDWPGSTNQAGGGGDSYKGAQCIVVGSRVLTTAGERVVELLHEGDFVASAKQRFIKNVITKVWRSLGRTIVTIGTANTEIRCTPEHRVGVLVGGVVRFVRAKKITLGTVLARSDGVSIWGEPVTVRETLLRDEPIEVFDLSLRSGPHTYIVNGVLCHNKPKNPP